MEKKKNHVSLVTTSLRNEQNFNLVWKKGFRGGGVCQSEGENDDGDIKCASALVLFSYLELIDEMEV